MQVLGDEDQTGRRIFRTMRRLWAYALENPVVFTVLFYGYVSIIGLIYNTVYFRQFGIAILEFYDLQDFLLGGLRSPTVLSVPVR